MRTVEQFGHDWHARADDSSERPEAIPICDAVLRRPPADHVPDNCRGYHATVDSPKNEEQGLTSRLDQTPTG
jgi:hypothetical protein